MILQCLLLVLSCRCILGFTTHYSLINCTWPCPNSSDKCTVTANGASCQPQTENTWVINSPRKAPIYTGAYVTIENVECIPVPIPELEIVKQNDTPPEGFSIVNWPILNARRPQDYYLGNCGHLLYCHQLNDGAPPVCIDRLDYGESCDSSNQCANGFCYNNICHPSNETIFNDGHTHNHTWTGNSENTPNRKTVEIVASIFGIVGAILFVVAGVLVYKRSKKMSLFTRKNKEEGPDSVDTQQQFATDFLYDDLDLPQPAKTTPVSQQEYLNLNMQQNIKSFKPPPYEP